MIWNPFEMVKVNWIWSPTFNAWKWLFHWKSNVHEWVCAEESFYQWHSDITTARQDITLYGQTPNFLSPYNSGLALYDAHIWRSSALPRAMRSLLKEQTFFGRMSFSRRAKNAIGLESTMAGQLLSGLCWWWWTHFRLISELFYTQRSREGGNSRERANIWKIFCSSEQGKTLLGKSAGFEV